MLKKCPFYISYCLEQFTFLKNISTFPSKCFKSSRNNLDTIFFSKPDKYIKNNKTFWI